MTFPVTLTLHISNRMQWRSWLIEHHASTPEVWLITYSAASGIPSIPYLDAVEEALCFGWIDGIAKRIDVDRAVQRFTPRRPKSHWTELNKERARRLIANGQMTPAGHAKLPDLSLDSFTVAPDILAAIQADPQTWRHFQQFPAPYVRIRIGYIEEVRRQPQVFQQRLNNFLNKTHQNKMFGVMK